MKPKTGFDAAIERAEHLLTLYDILCDKRARAARSDWSRRFKEFMSWPQKETIIRIDGERSFLILRERPGLTRTHFGHEYVSELLRSAVVASVSALDRYFHDLVTEHSWKLLGRRETKIPKELSKLRLPTLDVRRIVQRAKETGSRPGTLVKKSIQQQLHREVTFQGPNQVTKAAKMLGIGDFWGKVAAEMKDGSAGKEVQDALSEITRRRNQIVHEADLVVRSKGSKPGLRDLTGKKAKEWVGWTKRFGDAVQVVVDREL